MWFPYTSQSTSLIGSLDFFPLGYLKHPIYEIQNVLQKIWIYLRDSEKFPRMIWGRLMSQIYENPLETEVDVIARISPGFASIEKYAMYICARRQRT
jgi:hypothetical protein